MLSLFIIFIGTFWESGMDIISSPQNFKNSRWHSIALFFEAKGWKFIGINFWDNTISWRNKWKNRDPNQGEAFPFSSRFLVTFCDGWHVVKFIWLMHFFAAIVFYKPLTTYFLADILLLYIAFGIGHDLFWKLMKGKAES